MKYIYAILVTLAIALTMILFPSPVFSDVLLLPNVKLTPGAVNPAATKDVICVRGYTAGNDANGEPVRSVTEATKRKVFDMYKIDPSSDKFEIDHLISLQLGGANDVTNLWPQSYNTMPLNARVKDGLENTLHSLICKGKVSLADAQHDIGTDWIAAYKKYVGPLPK